LSGLIKNKYMISQLLENKNPNKKLFALLLDPENYSEQQVVNITKEAEKAGVNLILTGGSLISNSIDRFIRIIKSNCNIPVCLFPGNVMQISSEADGIFFLSLISGRNPDLLIGNHVMVARMLQNTDIEVIPTGYILVKSGIDISSVEYMSNTKPIPEDKTEIIVSTALAGEMLGLKAIYLEGGSGAESAISSNIIKEVKANINIPLIVGGGLKRKEDIRNVCSAGADMVVVGNAIEQFPEKLYEMANSVILY